MRLDFMMAGRISGVILRMMSGVGRFESQSCSAHRPLAPPRVSRWRRVMMRSGSWPTVESELGGAKRRRGREASKVMGRSLSKFRLAAVMMCATAPSNRPAALLGMNGIAEPWTCKVAVGVVDPEMEGAARVELAEVRWLRVRA